LNQLEQNDKRVEFIHHHLSILKDEYEKVGSSILILHGNPIEIFKLLIPKNVYCNNDYEPYAHERDKQVNVILDSKRSALYSFKDHVVFEKEEVTKDDGAPYTIFTPYSKKWKAKLNSYYTDRYPVEKYLRNLNQTSSFNFPELDEIGFRQSGIPFPDRMIRTRIIENYHSTRDFPGTNGTSRLSVHIRFGTVSIRQLVQVAIKKNESWLNELIWRDFYHMILWHFPHVESQAFKPQYDYVEWRNDEQDFQKWCEGKTGYPIVDAGMRELNETGFMHNRVRMIVASFLTKHLLIDWRWGEAYFAKKLLDFDLAANNGGWQWAAGCGCDAAPYFRVFNPYIQTEKFDPDHTYIKKWVPEFESNSYPKPIIEHVKARERVLSTYKKALQPV
jgi:deoxyribodipyrimidine photo-lyase